MCLAGLLPVRMDIFRWGKKKEVSSSMDDRFGDPSISAPTQGSWNEMPPLRPAKTDYPQSEKVSRLKSFLRSQTVNSQDYPIITESADFPRHPMVDMQNHQRPVSVDGIQGRLEKQRTSNGSSNGTTSRPRLASSPQMHRASYDSLSDSDDSDEDEREHSDRERDSIHRRDRQDSVRHCTTTRSRSQEDHWQVQQQHKTSRRNNQHKSPPLSSTAIMRRYSSQSESTRTYTSTPSTASFSSKHTSMTTPGLHRFSGSAIPPLLKEEEYYSGFNEHAPPPPLPALSLRDNRAGSATRHASPSSSPPTASHSSAREHSRGARSNKRQQSVPMGPQELVPSNDELWGY
jgi:hypothetical protein